MQDLIVNCEQTLEPVSVFWLDGAVLIDVDRIREKDPEAEITINNDDTAGFPRKGQLQEGLQEIFKRALETEPD